MLRLLLSGSILAALAACGSAAGSGDTGAHALLEETEGPKLRRFASAREFERFVRSVQERAAAAQKTLNLDASPAVMAPAEPVMNEATAVDAATANPEITNNQTVGVDEGGIVKQIGHHLVVLQDGRLFSVDLGTEAGAPLRLADRADVYRNPRVAAQWYDEMLVRGDRILVTAYSYSERATEITVFRIDPAGRLAREGRFLLNSDDYYSTENYATRLVGDKLVFYAPFDIASYGRDFQWPRLRRADGDGEAGRGEPLLGPTDVYAPLGEIEWPVIHAVSVCPLAEALDCRTTAFVGPPMREFYVSPSDAFLWIGAPDGLPWSIDYGNRRRNACPRGQYEPGPAQQALLYRLPLDGGPAGAVATDGTPTDQFAFDSRDGRFRALLARADAGCRPDDEEDERALALLDIPLSAFGSRLHHVAARAYTPLPAIEGGELENRFVGDWLVYGGRSGWSSHPPEGREQPTASTLFAVPLAAPQKPVRFDLPHNALRVERAGTDAVVTGYSGSDGLSLSYVSLGRQPRIASTALLPRRFESENRSHAFNAWIRSDGSGVIGLPTSARIWRSGRGWSDSESSELSFVAVSPAKALAAAGELGLRAQKPAQGYACEVSCVDWYGNSRPIFTGGRIFALMGTELVEGAMTGGRISEVARVDLTAALGAKP